MKCLLITDIFGLPAPDHPVISCLEKHADLTTLQPADLANMPQLVGEELHQFLFEKGGFETAATRISTLEPQFDIAIGFSVGGSLIWRACQEGLETQTVFCLSSTRLRKEKSKIKPVSHVFFGALDENRPDNEWLRSYPDFYLIGRHEDHGFYNIHESHLLQRALEIVSEKINLMN